MSVDTPWPDPATPPTSSTTAVSPSASWPAVTASIRNSRSRTTIPVAALKADRRRTGPVAVLRAYVALTKPRIVELLLVTTVPAMFLARGRLSPLGLTVSRYSGPAIAPISGMPAW